MISYTLSFVKQYKLKEFSKRLVYDRHNATN